MIYRTARLMHSFNVLYQAEEYTTRFGLLVTAMQDPFEKTILSGMSIRRSPLKNNSIRIDMGVFDYGKYIVQTNKWIDIEYPVIPPGNLQTISKPVMVFKPGVSFRFLPDEQTKDYSIVSSFQFKIDEIGSGERNLVYDLKNKETALSLQSDTPSVEFYYDPDENMITIKRFNTVDVSEASKYVLTVSKVSSDTNEYDMEDPRFKQYNEVEVRLKPEVNFVKIDVDTEGNVKLVKDTYYNYQYVLTPGEFLRVYFRRTLKNNNEGLSIWPEYGTYTYKFYKSEEKEPSKESTYIIGDEITRAFYKTDIVFNSTVETTRIAYEPGLMQKYHWIELYTLDTYNINKLEDVFVEVRQIYGTDFDESYFGMSFTPDRGLSWFYVNNINDVIIARFVPFDPVVITPIDPKLVHKIFLTGIEQEEVPSLITQAEPYSDYYNEEYQDLIDEVSEEINSLDNSGFMFEYVAQQVVSNLLQQTISVAEVVPYKVAVTFMYFHDSNIIEFQIKDVEDISEHDCLIGLLVTTDGKSFEVEYRDPIYQRMIPYAEWCDSLPQEMMLNASYLTNALSALTGGTNQIEQDDNGLQSIDTAIGNINTTYNLTQLGKDFVDSAALTSIKLYSKAFLQAQMLLYDFDYLLSIDNDVQNIFNNSFSTNGFVYENIVFLEKYQYAEYKIKLFDDISRLMVVPIYDRNTVDTDYFMLLNGERFAPFLEIDGTNRDFSEITIRFIATKQSMTLFGLGILYDRKTSGPIPLRINNMHNKQRPYFDYTELLYNENLSKQDIEKEEYLTIYVSWDMHSDDPADGTYVDIYVYDKFIYRSHNLSEIRTELKIHTSLLRIDDPMYYTDVYVRVPVVFKATNVYGETSVERSMLFLREPAKYVKFRDVKYLLNNIVVDDQETEDTSDDIKYYNFSILVSVDTYDRDDVIVKIWNDAHDESKGIYQTHIGNEILISNLTLREDELPRIVKVELETEDKSIYDERYLELSE